ncbi:MAG: GNAT family N-acetyltransferase [Maribacter sp.]|nr:GNAT family N-acetyltransferase [Maribacter sp.]NNK18900.1 GNAT family N-acetyltransferase [Maribacter sp.]
MKVFISTDKSLLDIERIHQYISNVSYWGRGRTLNEVEVTIQNSLCFGMYNDLNDQVGFARVVTDHVAFGYFMDVIVFDSYRGKGYGTKLMEYIMNHETVQNLKTIALKTKDAHELYEKFNFKSIGDSRLWMTNDKLKLI